MFALFKDSPEFKKRLATPFTPTKYFLQVQVTLQEVHSVVSKHLHKKNTLKALLYVIRDVTCAIILYKLGRLIDPCAKSLVQDYEVPQAFGTATKWSLWAFYWHWQGVVLAGWWCMAHEAGHGSLSDYSWFNHLVGYSLHTVRLSLAADITSLTVVIVYSRALLRVEVEPSCPPQGNYVCGAR
ncbi:hypothetical protein C0993_001036 [Termitomyces sp. T159_Od127]|nr:hypothetical protein C0993_001036 [Termitomyces sp. T159_Od127]